MVIRWRKRFSPITLVMLFFGVWGVIFEVLALLFGDPLGTIPRVHLYLSILLLLLAAPAGHLRVDRHHDEPDAGFPEW